MTSQPDTLEPPKAELDVLVEKALLEINKGSMTLADLLKALSPAQHTEPLPAILPKPAEISEKARAAMARVPDVFGQVVPTERRALEPVEVKSLIVEKQTLDEVKKMAEVRLGDVTVTIHNHLNVLIEQAEGYEVKATENGPVLYGPGDIEIIRDDKGNYVIAGEAAGPGEEQQFTREVKNYAASLSLAALQAQEAEGNLSHEDYLALTTQVRVVDEVKVLQALKKNPGLIKVIAKATTPGKKGTSVQLRKKR